MVWSSEAGVGGWCVKQTQPSEIKSTEFRGQFVSRRFTPSAFRGAPACFQLRACTVRRTPPPATAGYKGYAMAATAGAAATNQHHHQRKRRDIVRQLLPESEGS